MLHPTGALTALACSTLVAGVPAFAGPSAYVHTPIVQEGEREIDFKADSSRTRDGARESQHSIGLGLGVNRWWLTEVHAIWKKEPGEPTRFDAWEWENKFQLTETGKYPVDVAVLFEIERPKDRAEGYELRWGPLLQADLTPMIQANLNLLIEKHLRSIEASQAELGYQWQLKYRWKPAFEFGLQGLGNVGPWRKWEPRSEQPHSAGPAIFGRIALGARQAIKYIAGLLFGLTDAAPRRTLRLQAEYEL